MFDHPAYIVLDPPAPMDEKVAQLRKQAHPTFPPLPLEITIAGSSGVGPINPHESPDRIFAILSDLAARTQPLKATFHSIERFPASPVAYLSLADATPFVALHNAILSTPIRFRASPFPFRPHCTIRSPSAGILNDSEFQRIQTLPVPVETFQLHTLSVYELDATKQECRRLHQTTFSAR